MNTRNSLFGPNDPRPPARYYGSHLQPTSSYLDYSSPAQSTSTFNQALPSGEQLAPGIQQVQLTHNPTGVQYIPVVPQTPLQQVYLPNFIADPPSQHGATTPSEQQSQSKPPSAEGYCRKLNTQCACGKVNGTKFIYGMKCNHDETDEAMEMCRKNHKLWRIQSYSTKKSTSKPCSNPCRAIQEGWVCPICILVVTPDQVRVQKGLPFHHAKTGQYHEWTAECTWREVPPQLVQVANNQPSTTVNFSVHASLSGLVNDVFGLGHLAS
jgi:hypothetical protein